MTELQILASRVVFGLLMSERAAMITSPPSCELSLEVPE